MRYRPCRLLIRLEFQREECFRIELSRSEELAQMAFSNHLYPIEFLDHNVQNGQVFRPSTTVSRLRDRGRAFLDLQENETAEQHRFHVITDIVAKLGRTVEDALPLQRQVENHCRHHEYILDCE